MLPRWSLPAATTTAVVSYLGWIAAGAEEYRGREILTGLAATAFWLSLMVLTAFAVQRAVARYRNRDRG